MSLNTIYAASSEIEWYEADDMLSDDKWSYKSRSANMEERIAFVKHGNPTMPDVSMEERIAFIKCNNPTMSDRDVAIFLQQYASEYAFRFIDEVITGSILSDYDDWASYTEDLRTYFEFKENRNRFYEKWAKRVQSYYFKNVITKELIAKAMKPSRIEAQMNQFDDIEDFFESMGY